jgi:hypothetical protein
LKDYKFTTSARFSECAGFSHNSFGHELLIYLTARDTKSFSSKAKCINNYSSYLGEWDLTFFFFGNRNYAWNRSLDEVPSFTATDSEGNSFTFTLNYLND